MIVLAQEQWRARAGAHAARVEPWIAPRLARRSRGEKHPVDDFLFDYYPVSPARLRRWHPGHGVALAGPGAGEWLQHRGYVQTADGVTIDPSGLTRRVESLRWTAALLELTAAREPRYGCFGLHEWAMVHGLAPDEVRHAAWPLRLTPAEIDAVVAAQPLRCTHFDAFRFFTPSARPLNERALTRADQPEHEQPGCLHATMDLYKWASKASPYVGSDLVADAFALAREVRTIDMRAAPYDLRDLGLDPIAVESPEGRAEYVAHQRTFAERGALLRARLLAELRRLLDAVGEAPDP